MRPHDIRPDLSKSRIASFQHCPKRLWLQVHRRELGHIDERTKALFAAGHKVGELARAELPSGILVDNDHRDVDGALARTRELLTGGWASPIFEAAFERDGVVIRADILKPDQWGGWSLIEVKNSTYVSSYMLQDVATQAWVAAANRICVSSVILRLRRRRLIHGRPDSVPGFIDTEVTSNIRGMVRHRRITVDNARRTLSGVEPERKIGPHCTRPFSCEFQTYCGQLAADAGERDHGLV